MRYSLLALALLVAACGDDSQQDIDSGPTDAAGGSTDANPLGTGTLLITGSFVVDDELNILEGGDLRVDCELRITLDGEPVTAAEVTLNPASSVQVLLVGDELDPSHYEGHYTGYAQTVRLSVELYPTSRPDFLAELTLQGPRLFQIESPIDHNVPAGTPLHVTWSQPGGQVDSADLETQNGYQSLGLIDSGAADVPGEFLSIDNPDDELWVTRWKENPLGAGAAPGSVVHYGVRSHLPITVTAL